MFKKHYKITTQSILSSKDRKKLFSELQKQFDKESIVQLNKLSPEMYVQKVEKSKIVIYRNALNPLFVAPISNENIFPTIYALDLFPNLVKQVFYISDDVLYFIENGANLMWKGVINFYQLQHFNSDELVSIRLISGKTVAIGTIPLGKELIEKMNKIEGIAAVILHFMNDALFKSGNQNLNQYFEISNQKIYSDNDKKEFDSNKSALPSLFDYSQSENKEDLKKDFNISTKVDFLSLPNQTKSKTCDEQEKDFQTTVEEDNFLKIPLQQEANIANDDPIFNNMDLDGLKDDDDSQKKVEDFTFLEKTAKLISVKEIDQIIFESFMNSIVLTVKPTHFPIENSTFWTQHMSISCASGKNLPDIKNSSYKKMSKFFSEMEKKGFLRYKEASKKNPTPLIENINKSHEFVKSWIPTISAPIQKEKTVEIKSVKFDCQFQIENLFEANELVQSYFGEVKLKHLYSEKQIADLLTLYSLKENLVLKKNVLLNSKLKSDFHFDSLVSPSVSGKTRFNLANSESSATEEEFKKEDEEIKKKELFQVSFKTLLMKFLLNCTPWSRITETKTGKQSLKKGKHTEVIIYIEKNSNRFHTRVSGLDAFGFNLKEIQHSMQLKFASSASLSEKVSKKIEVEEINVQGAFKEEMKTFLETELGLADEMIKIVDKVGLKKKRK